MSFTKFNLNGKTALITGGAGLLGIEHAFALLESGSKIILSDTNSKILKSAEKLLLKNYSKDLIDTQIMDVTKEEDILKVLNKYKSQEDKIHILINNAALNPKIENETGSPEFSRLENFSLDQWNLEINVGLTGAFLCSKFFGTYMAQNSGGVILNIASDLSVISPDQRLYLKKKQKAEFQNVKPITYSVIKTGLIGLTRYLSTYWAEEGVRCNSLSPGGIYNGQDEEFVSRIEKLIPMGRMANKDEYRSSIQFLCSEASSYMNGQNLIIDGGRSVW